jgi:hypothetical protein
MNEASDISPFNHFSQFQRNPQTLLVTCPFKPRLVVCPFLLNQVEFANLGLYGFDHLNIRVVVLSPLEIHHQGNHCRSDY